MSKRPVISMPSKSDIYKVVKVATKKWGENFTLYLDIWTDGTSCIRATHGHQGNGFMKKTGEELLYKNGILTLTKFRIKRYTSIVELERREIKLKR